MGREGGRTTGKRQPHRQWVGAATKWGQGGTERGRQGREGTDRGGAPAGAMRRGVKQRGRKGTGPRASISLCRALTGGASQLRPDWWRGKASAVSGSGHYHVRTSAVPPCMAR